MTTVRTLIIAGVALTWFVEGVTYSFAQEKTPNGEPLTREEFTQFLKEYQQFKSEIVSLRETNAELKKQLVEIQASQTNASDPGWNARFERRMLAERRMIMQQVHEEWGDSFAPVAPGLSNFAFSGFAALGYQDLRRDDSTFGAMLSPIMLWKPTERLLFEAEIGLRLNEEDTEVELGYAHMTYLLNDYVTLGAGKFLLPFGTFWERLHPSWINKLPTAPLMARTVPESGIGVQVRGGFPIGTTKINYAAYYVNGPTFRETLPGAGRLDFERNLDNNNSKAYGGRIGFLPIPEMEIGYSFLTGRVGDSGGIFRKVDTVMHGLDFAYAREFDALRGRLDLRGEFNWTNTDDVIFVGPFDPFTFDNNSNGWYVQAAYRPTLVDVTFGEDFELKNCEFIIRYDQLRRPGSRDLGIDRDQVTLGVDYWIMPNVVVKAAYVIDNSRGGDDQDGFFLQTGIGF